ncbi:MAG TPA: hypothetical protein VGQ41_06060 [Pyrinomonadaceae bacterium]|nr:hypothetical protein [Pyrinomonadaceae bacterium]
MQIAFVVALLVASWVTRWADRLKDGVGDIERIANEFARGV